MLADTLRTDRARLVALTRDSKATIALRRTCRARKDLVGHRVAAANQRRAHLQTVFPGPVGLFTDLDSPISLAFLARFDCQDRAGWLSVKRLAAWLASVGYAGRVPAAELYARLVAAPRGASGSHGAVQAHITRAFLALLTTLNQQINALTAEIGQQLAAHADRQIFTSLPRSGKIRAARLLAEIGDCRRRFPTPWNRWPASSAWPLPPGKSRAVGFPWACDKQLRDAVFDFAGDSRHANPWAADLYARARGHDHPTRSVSWPVPGCSSSGAAGSSTPATTPADTEPCNVSSTKSTKLRLDTRHLARRASRPEGVSDVVISSDARGVTLFTGISLPEVGFQARREVPLLAGRYFCLILVQTLRFA